MLDGIWGLLALLPLAAHPAGTSVVAHAPEDPATPINADYLCGISHLVNDDADRAIAAFVRLLDVDNDTAETHLARRSSARSSSRCAAASTSWRIPPATRFLHDQ